MAGEEGIKCWNGQLSEMAVGMSRGAGRLRRVLGWKTSRIGGVWEHRSHGWGAQRFGGLGRICPTPFWT